MYGSTRQGERAAVRCGAAADGRRGDIDEVAPHQAAVGMVFGHAIGTLGPCAAIAVFLGHHTAKLLVVNILTLFGGHPVFLAIVVLLEEVLHHVATLVVGDDDG